MSTNHVAVLFDDQCNKCTRWADFIRSRDPKSNIKLVGQMDRRMVANGVLGGRLGWEVVCQNLAGDGAEKHAGDGPESMQVMGLRACWL